VIEFALTACAQNTCKLDVDFLEYQCQVLLVLVVSELRAATESIIRDKTGQSEDPRLHGKILVPLTSVESGNRYFLAILQVEVLSVYLRLTGWCTKSYVLVYRYVLVRLVRTAVICWVGEFWRLTDDAFAFYDRPFAIYFQFRLSTSSLSQISTTTFDKPPPSEKTRCAAPQERQKYWQRSRATLRDLKARHA
jgi:hypothetical protein